MGVVVEDKGKGLVMTEETGGVLVYVVVEAREDGFASVDAARGVDDNGEDIVIGEVPARGRDDKRGLEEPSNDGLAGDACKKGLDLPEFEDITTS